MNLLQLFSRKLHSFSLLLILCCFSACVSFDKSELNNLNHQEVIKIGHAGSGFSSWIPFNPYPANSYTSLRKALVEQKANGVEVDVHMTSDEEFVLYHDNKLDSKTSLKGCIGELNYDAILKTEYQLGIPFDWFQSEQIIGLDTIIKLMKAEKDFPFLHLDIRHQSVCLTPEQNLERQLIVINRLINKLIDLEIPRQKVVLISMSRELILEAKRLNCPFELSLEEVGDFQRGLDWVKNQHLNYLTIKPGLLTAEKSAIAHEAGVKVITFGAKSRSGNKRLLKLNPDVIQTNNLNALKSLLES